MVCSHNQAKSPPFLVGFSWIYILIKYKLEIEKKNGEKWKKLKDKKRDTKNIYMRGWSSWEIKSMTISKSLTTKESRRI